jgi:hypothetical protein
MLCWHTSGALSLPDETFLPSERLGVLSYCWHPLVCCCRQGLGLEPTSEAAAPTANASSTPSPAAAAAAAPSASEASGKLLYLVPRQQQQRLGLFLNQLEQHSRQLGVHDVQCSLASLEEVFLTIVKQVRARFETLL